MSNMIKTSLSNGMVVLAEQMPNVASAAFIFKLPCGEMYAPNDNSGVGSILADWLFRGTQRLNNKELSDKLDYIGLHRSSGISYSHLSFGAALESGNLPEALGLFAEIIQTPRFDSQQFGLSKELSTQELISLDDDPRQKVMTKLREQFYPYPYGRNTMGTLESLKNLSENTAKDFYKNHLNFSNSIFAIAGKFDLDKICSQLNGLFNTKFNCSSLEIKPVANGIKYTHNNYDGAQIHIGLMTAADSIIDKNYYQTLVAAETLGGGMSSRLFTEVREKRGLCYAIGSKYGSIKGMGAISCYAGTVPEKAQQTLDTIVDEFNKLSAGITQDELNIAKVGLKSSLIMSGESSSARAGGIASDYYLLNRVRTFDEIKEKIDAITLDGMNEFLNSKKFNNFTVYTIGPKELKVSQ